MQPCGWPSILSSTAFILNLSRIDDEGSRVTGAGLCVSRTVRSMASTRAAHERFRASVPATAYFKLIFWRGSRRRRARASTLFCWRLTGCRTQQPATAARFERPVLRSSYCCAGDPGWPEIMCGRPGMGDRGCGSVRGRFLSATLSSLRFEGDLCCACGAMPSAGNPPIQVGLRVPHGPR